MPWRLSFLIHLSIPPVSAFVGLIFRRQFILDLDHLMERLQVSPQIVKKQPHLQSPEGGFVIPRPSKPTRKLDFTSLSESWSLTSSGDLYCIWKPTSTQTCSINLQAYTSCQLVCSCALSPLGEVKRFGRVSSSPLKECQKPLEVRGNWIHVALRNATCIRPHLNYAWWCLKSLKLHTMVPRMLYKFDWDLLKGKKCDLPKKRVLLLQVDAEQGFCCNNPSLRVVFVGINAMFSRGVLMLL